MNTRHLIIVAVLVVVSSLAAVQVFGLPQYYGWGSPSMMGLWNGHMNQMNHGYGCNMMNGEGMDDQMNGQPMNYQQCQQHMGPNQAMMPQQCQAMYQYCQT